MLTLTDIYDKLLNIDEVTLLEILDISTEDIIERFKDKIEDNYDELRKDFEEEEEYENE
jgi:hypothetical protein